MASSGGIGGSSPSHWHLFGDEGHSVKWHSCRTCDLVLSYRPEAILLPVDTFQEAEMATGDADALGPLEFTSYDVTDLASLAPYFLPTQDRCGIYVLRFEDGFAYVGQAGDVVRRFADHYRDWTRKRPGIPIVRIEFAPCEPQSLNAAELAMISKLEQDTDLLNKLGTNFPGGRGDIEVTVTDAPAISIPVDRARRPRLREEYDARKLRRYLDYSLDPHSEAASLFAGVYLAETMPAPSATAGSSWTCTAMPDTAGRTRLFTLNVGGLEVLYVYYRGESRNEARPWVAMNVALPEDRSGAALEISGLWCEAAIGTYKSEPVWSWRFDLESLTAEGRGDVDAELARLFAHDDELFDLAYKLNRRLMARRPSMWISNHNDYLAADFLSKTLAADALDELG